MKHFSRWCLILLPLLAALLKRLFRRRRQDRRPAARSRACAERGARRRAAPLARGGQCQSLGHRGRKPRVTGEIQEVHFKEGQDVRAGESLISIDPRPFEAALREKRGLLAKSQAQLSKANDDMRRYGKLVGGGYVSREAYEQTATEAAASRPRCSRTRRLWKARPWIFPTAR